MERMKILELLDLPEESVIRDFEENNTVYVSKPRNTGIMVGVLYKLSDEERRLVEKIEEEYGILVYHVIKNETAAGAMYTMLSVSEHEEEWNEDRETLKGIDTDAARPMAYVWSVEGEDLSNGFGEWGTITVIGGEGGLCRIK